MVWELVAYISSHQTGLGWGHPSLWVHAFCKESCLQNLTLKDEVLGMTCIQMFPGTGSGAGTWGSLWLQEEEGLDRAAGVQDLPRSSWGWGDIDALLT